MSSFKPNIMNLNQSKSNTIKINNKTMNIYKYYNELILPSKKILDLYKLTYVNYVKSLKDNY
jgi:hypothetical protein